MTGRRFVAREEQGVYSFAPESGGGDPPAWAVEDDRWQLMGQRLTRFLLQYALFEGIGLETGADRWGLHSVAEAPAA